MNKRDIRRLDREFSELIRSKGSCERCGKRVTLQTSHIYSRRYLSIRWTPLNAMCLCAGCHLWWHHRPVDAIEWAQGYMGSEAWEQLKKLSRGVKKWATPEEVREQWRGEKDDS